MKTAKAEKNTAIYDRIVEPIKTALLVILFFTMVFLAGLYFTRSQRASIEPAAFADMNSLLVLKDSASAERDSAEELLNVLPSFIGFNLGGQRKGVYGNTDMIGALYKVVSGSISDALGPGRSCKLYSEEAGAALIEEIKNDKSYIYVKYPFAVPAPLIHAYYFGTENGSMSDICGGSVLMITDIFIITDNYFGDTQSFRVVAVSADGSVGEYFPSDLSVENPLNFDISSVVAYYNNTDFIDFSFYSSSCDNSVIGFSSTAVKMSADMDARRISASAPTDLTALDEKSLSELFKLFSFTSSRVSSYPGEDSLYYVESNGMLCLTADGKAEFTTSEINGGISLSDFLGYINYSGSYTLQETLIACAGLASRAAGIDGLGMLKDAEAVLNGIDYSEGVLNVYFGYKCYGLGVTDSNGEKLNFCVITVSDNKITAVSLYAVGFTRLQEVTVLLPQSWTLREAYEQDGGIVTSVSAVYRYNGTEDKLSAEWMVNLRGKAEENPDFNFSSGIR